MPQKLIAYECVTPGHAPSLQFPDKLTVHEGAWAFCPFDAHADGHTWRETGGENIDEISRRFGLSALRVTVADAPQGAKR
jgi:hypothetical protein